jgi:hypothetical protein
MSVVAWSLATDKLRRFFGKPLTRALHRSTGTGANSDKQRVNKSQLPTRVCG